MSDKESDPIEMSKLWEKIGSLEERLNESKKGFLGWINKWGVLIGMIATCLSIIGGTIGISTSIRNLNPKPNTKVFELEDKFIYREFNSEEKRIILKTNFIITNNGDADDLILVKAFLKVPELLNEDIVHSYGNDYEITDANGKKLTRPFVLAKSTNQELIRK
jgi:hypothetical protein